MTDWNLFGSTAGPATPANYPPGNPFVAGVQFAPRGPGCYLLGYRLWVCQDAGIAGSQPVTPTKFALWSVTGGGTGKVIPAGTVTSGTLTPGQWNDVMLAQPVPLAASLDPVTSTSSSAYIASAGVNGPFPSTDGQFGASGAYAGGITSGPLTAFSDQGGTLPGPYAMPQGLFAVASDPAATMPGEGSGSGNFWVDVIVADTRPAGYAGTDRLWPKWDANSLTGGDAEQDYEVDIELWVSARYQYVTLVNSWHYSPSGATELPTEVNVWEIGNPEEPAAQIASPSWSGAAGTGWISAAWPENVTLPPGKYRSGCYCANGTQGIFNAKDADSEYHITGAGSEGLGDPNGPIYAPYWAQAAQANVYQGSGTTYGQSVFAVGPPDAYPDETTGNSPAQVYWSADLEVQAGPLASGGSALLAAAGIV